MRQASRALALAAVATFLGACAGIPKPQPVRTDSQVLYRGWNYVEPAPQQWNLESGVQPLNFSSPVLTKDRLVFGSSRFGIMALDKSYGRVLWRRDVPDGVSATPLVQEGKVFIGGDDGVFRALDLESGREIWATAPKSPFHGAPILIDGRVIASSVDDAVHAFDAATGKLLWSYRRTLTGKTAIKGGGNPSYIGGKIWAGFSDGALVALEPNDGTVVSEKMYSDNIKFSDVDAKPIAWRDGVIVATYDGKLRYLKRDGTTIWELPAGGGRAPVIVDSVLYYPSSEGTVYAIQGETGKVIWKFSINRGVPTGLGYLSHKGDGDDRKLASLAVSTSDQRVYLLDAKTGKVLGKSNFGHGSGSYANVAVDEDTNSFYVLSHYSRMYQFKVLR